jgi:hypothetical protein
VSILLKRSAPWEVSFAIRLPTETCFSFDPYELTLADVRSENAQFVKRLRTATCLETMKQALEDKDTQASAFEEEKTTLNDKVVELLKKKAELEQYIKAFSKDMSKKLKGMVFSRVNITYF